MKTHIKLCQEPLVTIWSWGGGGGAVLTFIVPSLTLSLHPPLTHTPHPPPGVAFPMELRLFHTVLRAVC